MAPAAGCQRISPQLPLHHCRATFARFWQLSLPSRGQLISRPRPFADREGVCEVCAAPTWAANEHGRGRPSSPSALRLQDLLSSLSYPRWLYELLRCMFATGYSLRRCRVFQLLSSTVERGSAGVELTAHPLAEALWFPCFSAPFSFLFLWRLLLKKARPWRGRPMFGGADSRGHLSI